jgi:hypothetical protein
MKRYLWFPTVDKKKLRAAPSESLDVAAWHIARSVTGDDATTQHPSPPLAHLLDLLLTFQIDAPSPTKLPWQRRKQGWLAASLSDDNDGRTALDSHTDPAVPSLAGGEERAQQLVVG